LYRKKFFLLLNQQHTGGRSQGAVPGLCLSPASRRASPRVCLARARPARAREPLAFPPCHTLTLSPQLSQLLRLRSPSSRCLQMLFQSIDEPIDERRFQEVKVLANEALSADFGDGHGLPADVAVEFREQLESAIEDADEFGRSPTDKTILPRFKFFSDLDVAKVGPKLIETFKSMIMQGTALLDPKEDMVSLSYMGSSPVCVECLSKLTLLLVHPNVCKRTVELVVAFLNVMWVGDVSHPSGFTRDDLYQTRTQIYKLSDAKDAELARFGRKRKSTGDTVLVDAYLNNDERKKRKELASAV